LHHQTEALSMADRILVLRAGQRQQLAAPHTLYHTPANEFVARFIGSAPMNFLPVSARDRSIFSTPTLGWHSCSVERDRPGRQS
jgi:multiple sugar transport system ATP-binding protein